jgi:hypothetical protein
MSEPVQRPGPSRVEELERECAELGEGNRTLGGLLQVERANMAEPVVSLVPV